MWLGERSPRVRFLPAAAERVVIPVSRPVVPSGKVGRAGRGFAAEAMTDYYNITEDYFEKDVNDIR